MWKHGGEKKLLDEKDTRIKVPRLIPKRKSVI